MSVLPLQSRGYLPQALTTAFTSRVLKDPDNSLILNTAPKGRSAKRSAQQINYAEFDNFSDDVDLDDMPTAATTTTAAMRNHTGNHSFRQILKPVRRNRYPEIIDNEHKLTEALHKSDVILVPIRLNIDFNGGASKLVDFFMWNLNEVLLTPEDFAVILCNDLELPSGLQSEIAESISRQTDEFNYAQSLQLQPNMPHHVIIDLSVNLNRQLYQDRFEWDLSQDSVTPEMFAEIVVADLGLSLEFKAAISHSLHEAILKLKKEIVDGTHNIQFHNYQQNGGLIYECGIRINTETSVHNGNDHWEPIVEILTPWEIEKREIERERNIRRLKRENIRREVDDFGTHKRRATHRRRFEDLDTN